MQKFQGNRVRNDDVIRVFREALARHLFRSSHLKKLDKNIYLNPNKKPQAYTTIAA